MLTNASKEILKLAEANGGQLPAYAWPGGYEIVYLDKDNCTLCPDCANKANEYSQPITAYWVAECGSDETVQCEDCNKVIVEAND